MAKQAAHIQGPPLAQAVSSQTVPVMLLDATDLVSLEVGVVTPTIEISKNGGAFAAPNDGTWTEISDGWYTITLDDTDTEDSGWILLRVVKSSISEETTILCLVSTSPAEQREQHLRIGSLYQER